MLGPIRTVLRNARVPYIGTRVAGQRRSRRGTAGRVRPIRRSGDRQDLLPGRLLPREPPQPDEGQLPQPRQVSLAPDRRRRGSHCSPADQQGQLSPLQRLAFSNQLQGVPRAGALDHRRAWLGRGCRLPRRLACGATLSDGPAERLTEGNFVRRKLQSSLRSSGRKRGDGSRSRRCRRPGPRACHDRGRDVEWRHARPRINARRSRQEAARGPGIPQ